MGVAYLCKMKNRASSLWQRLPHLLPILLFGGVIVFVSLLFPNNLTFNYEFARQQVWRYNDLHAPFDFAIRKTEDALAAEREERLATLTPIYEMDSGVARERKAAFSDAFSRQLSQVRAESQFQDVPRRQERYLRYGLSFLDRLYQRGIILLAPQHREMGGDFVVNILRGNTAQQQTLDNILKPEEARALLADSLPYSRLAEPEFIFPLLEEQIQANLFYNDTLTEKLRETALEEISPTHGLVPRGELIVQQGGIVTDSIYQVLVSLQEEYNQQIFTRRSYLGVYLGYLLLTSLVVLVFAYYLRNFAHLIYGRPQKLVFILLWPVLYSYLVYIIEGIEGLSTYLIPFCIAPIVIKTFYNEQLALFTHLIVVLLASFLTSLGYEFTFLQLLAGVVVILSNIDTRDWSRFFYSMLSIFLSYGLGFLGLSLVREGSIAQVDWSVYSWLFINVLLTLLAYPLIPLLERLFGFVSPITLVELSDMNRPLLRQLALRAPGTLQHSLQVGNLAEAAARRIGADPLLVKVAALYHDIGKTKNPEYFIENQSGQNPHAAHDEKESAQIIIAHVTEGVRMARKAGLPPILVDFILTHHGTTRAEYFFRNYLKMHPDEEVDDTDFRYPGPRPRTKEETILMLADSIEAACKSLKDPTQEELFGLIDKIIDGKVQGGQLEDSRISFQELEITKGIFRQIMKSVHHVRIAYPEEATGEHRSSDD